MTRNQILAQFPEIMTITQFKKYPYFLQHPEEITTKGYQLHQYKEKRESRTDFNFIIWRTNRSRSTGEILFEGPCMAAYTREVAQIFASSMNTVCKDDSFTVRAVA